MKVTVHGIEYDRDAVAALMDDEIREYLHDRSWEGTPQQAEQAFIDAYCREHEAKYGIPFVIG